MIDSLHDFSLWGGNNSYSPETEKLIINRPYWLYSNIIITLYAICKLKTFKYNVKSIELYLNEYMHNYNFYPDLFLHKETNEEIITIEEAISVIEDLHPSIYGFGSDMKSFDKQKLQKNIRTLIKIYNHYFTNNSSIQNHIDDIIKKHSIQLDSTVFIWARRTDKSQETDLPDAPDYIRETQNYKNIKKILIQTDDSSFVNEFKELNNHLIEFINELPYSKTSSRGFHNHLSSICNDYFQQTHGISKIDYLKKFLAITYIASRSKYFISYPGNMITIVPIIRQNFDNCKLFLNKNEII